MKIKSIVNSSYVGWIVIIAALILWYVFYFFSYVPNQESKLRERGFRILQEFASNMLEKHEYYNNHFDNYGPYYHLREYIETLPKDEFDTVEAKLSSAVKIATEGLNPEIHRRDSIAKKGFNTIGFQQNYEPSFYFNKEKHRETFIVPVHIFMEGLKFDRLFESIVLFDSTAVYNNTNNEIVYDITNPEALIDSAQNLQGGFTQVIEVRGEKKRVLVLPVNLVQKQFYLAGVITDTDFKRKTRSINFQILIFIAGLLMVLLVGIPILKIKLMDPYDHLNASDTQMAALSMVVSAGILVLISIGLTHHKIVDRHFQKDRLINISDTLHRNVDEDLTMIVDFYKSFTDTSDDSTPLHIKIYEVLFDKVGGYQQFVKTDALPFPMNEILLIDTFGIAKSALSTTQLSEKDTLWVNNGDTMEFKLLDLNQRQYFQNAIDTTKSWYRKEDKKNVYIQSITSYNTGHREAAVSFYLKNPVNDTSAVIAITTEFPTFYKQVLPADVEFAIVNDQGEVLFHSIPYKNLHENFLNESDLNPTLLGAVRLRIVETTRIDYNEKPWLIRMKPIEDTPLILITMLDVQQMQNRNSRIILFTFYFFMVTLLFILLEMLFIQLSKPRDRDMNSKSWFFNWLAFRPEDYMRYKLQLFVILLVLIMQAGGAFLIKKPVTMLVYQLLFILFSIFISYIILTKRKLHLDKYYKKGTFPIILMLLLLLLVYAALVRLTTPIVFILSFVLPVLIYFLVQQNFRRLRLPKNENQLQHYPLIPFRAFEKRHLQKHTYKPKRNFVRNVFNFGMFFWILSLSFIPIIHFYRTVKMQEEEIWQRVQMMHVAEKNLALAKEFNNETNNKWMRRIQGNGIDSLTITYPASDKIKPEPAEDKLDVADRIYRLLADPLTDGDQHMSYLKESNYYKEWHIDKNSRKLYVSSPVSTGTVSVENKSTPGVNLRWFWFLVPAVFILVLLWFVLSYVNKYTLATKKNRWNFQNSIDLTTLFSEVTSKRVLVYSFDEKKLERSATKKAKAGLSGKKFRILPATNLLNADYPDYLVKNENRIIWISDIELCIPRIEMHEVLLNRLLSLVQKAEGQIILLLPFDVEFIHEFYEDYIHDNKIEGDEKTSIYKLKRLWDIVFKEFRRYYIPELKQGQIKDGFSLHALKKQFYLHIWNNLCRNEKLVLYDLAEDGLINLKNERMINRLMNKGLITAKQYPEIYSEGFKYFIDNSVKPGEKKALQKSATFKGMWHNIRYPIMFVLIVIVAFIFVSQGYSFEKVTAVFAGVLTLIATMTKLFEGK